jgi:hypothetical protein
MNTRVRSEKNFPEVMIRRAEENEYKTSQLLRAWRR